MAFDLSGVYDAKNGTVFGRNAGSWLRITLFYLVYYTFLAALMYFFVTTYQGNLDTPGGKAPKITTRVDQPGTAVYPLANITERYDKENAIILDTDLALDSTKEYIARFQDFKTGYDLRSKDAVDCTGEQVKTKTCRVKNADLLTDDNIKNSVRDQKPIFALSLNKVYGWEPINYRVKPEFLPVGTKFVKNSVYVKCFNTKIDGEMAATKKEEEAFNISFYEGSDPALAASYFPYQANDKKAENPVAYNKPFVLVQIEAKDSSSWDQQQFFSCYWDANNLNRPQFVEKWSEQTKKWSMELEKMALGITKFSVQYQKKKADE